MPAGGRLQIETSNQLLDEDYVARIRDAVEGAYVMLAVTDTGTGISPEALSHVLEPFFTDQGSRQGNRAWPQHGATASSSNPTAISGSTARLDRQRRYISTAARRERRAAPATKVDPIKGREQILVVEDDSQVRASVGAVEKPRLPRGRSSGQRSGSRRTQGNQGSVRPLLLTDVVMPGKMGGKALADEAARRWPRMAIVFMSGYTEDAIIHQEGSTLIGVHLLTKPFRKHDLAAMVRKTLDAPRSSGVGDVRRSSTEDRPP